MPEKPNEPLSRRTFVADGLRVAGALGVVGLTGFLAGRRGQAEAMVWQIDPEKCVACGNCQTRCVLDESAVKCVHTFAMCGYCTLCTGYFHEAPEPIHSGAAMQLCPTGAIRRTHVEDQYFEYTIDEALCIGCAKCVQGCTKAGNGSLHLQVRHDRCVHCNDCSIALACPAQAFVRVPASSPYLFKHK